MSAADTAGRMLLCALPGGGQGAALETLRAMAVALGGRVMWLARPGEAGALFDLGVCSATEALQAGEWLIARLERRGLAINTLGIGATTTLAHLAALLAAPHSVRALDRDWLATAGQRLPIDLLARLEPALVTPDTLMRLRHYGLTAWGRIARLDERDPHALRRQFGPTGSALAALIRGDEARPFAPEPLAERVRARLRFSAGAGPNQVFAAVPALAERLARRLAAHGWQGRQGRDLRLRVAWGSGAVTRARRAGRPLATPSELAQAAHRLLTTLLPDAAPSDARRAPVAITALTLTLSDLSARPAARPEPLFCEARAARDPRHERATRLARLIAEVGAPLAQRYGAPALYRLECARPDAILPEERALLVPLSLPDAWPETAPGVLPTLAREPVRSAAGGAARGVTPPQPHWW